jgi:eukaryotic-like serine/threonine-protein kinase
VLRRGLAKDREDRYPDVTAFVTALERALGSTAVGPAETPWIARDPDLTEPGPRPTDLVDAAPTSSPSAAPPRRRRRTRILVPLLVGALALVVGAGGGYAAQRSVGQPTTRTVTDDQGSITVTVPASWDADGTAGWRPPRSASAYPGLSVGTSGSWASSANGQGVFAGLLPAANIPTQLPQHPECATKAAPVSSTRSGDDAVTVVYAGCPGGVVAERVVKVAANTLLWVQVRAADRAIATGVLDDVRTEGL